MKKNLLFQFLSLVIPVALLFTGLRQVNWVKIFHVQQLSESTEAKIGKVFKEIFTSGDKEIHQTDVTETVNKLFKRICLRNHIEAENFRIYIIKNKMVNAFALPDKQMVIYTGLLKDCDSFAELCGVMAHELAHIQQRHITKKLIAEMGLSAVIAIGGGNAGGTVIRDAAQHLASSAYSRKMEKEADMYGAGYLYHADIPIEPLANFMFRLAAEHQGDVIPSWLNSHPDSEERAKYLMEYAQTHKIIPGKVLEDGEWERLKEIIDTIGE